MVQITWLLVVTLAAIVKPTLAWVPSHSHQTPPNTARVTLQAEAAFATVGRALASAFLTASIWTAAVPAFDYGAYAMHPPSAVAKEMASGSGSRVNKDAESLLRYGLPIKNKDVRQLQGTLEDIKTDIGTKRKAAALDGVKKSKTLLAKPDKYTISCRNTKVCTDAIVQMQADLDPLSNALKDSQESFTGSDQERAALDSAYDYQRRVIEQLTILEEQMVPAGYKTIVPAAYSDLAQLQGRATVEMVLKKADGKSPFNVEGQNYPQAKLVMVVDGYAAPVTSGNFVDLVLKGFYNNMQIQRSDGFVVQTGDPDGEADGYVGPGSKTVGQGKHGERLIPLEIFVRGDAGPFYETTIEDEGRGGQATVLPFASYGAMGWAREEYDPNTGSSQFFWLLFDSDLTPAGKNVLDGRYPCFGYVVEGADFLQDVKEGDLIVSAKVVSGAENLVQPK
ncbi:hypothetical protein MPSEU_000354300 [Mayamaea pseudoterrestris]|nr:hypothetical protein MPSEU_000354300 [Mayamaea pseudoterrestris]